MLNCLLPMCYSHIEAGIKFIGTKMCVALFLKTPLYVYPAETALGFRLCFMSIHMCVLEMGRREMHTKF